MGAVEEQSPQESLIEERPRGFPFRKFNTKGDGGPLKMQILEGEVLC